MISVNLKPESTSWWDRFKAHHLVSWNIRNLKNRGEIQLGLCEIADRLDCPVIDETHPLYTVYLMREDLLGRGFRFQGCITQKEAARA